MTPQHEKCQGGPSCGKNTQVGTFYALGMVGKLPRGGNFHYELCETCRMSLVCSFNFYTFTKDLWNPRHYARARKTKMTLPL